jgi:hypothetical protein
MAVRNDPRSIPDIFAEVAKEFTTLMSKEAQLARSEMSEQISGLTLGLGLLIGGSILLIPAPVILLQGAVAALLTANVALVWATLIVGGATVTVGMILLALGIGRLKSVRSVPRKTIGQLQQDAQIGNIN